MLALLPSGGLCVFGMTSRLLLQLLSRDRLDRPSGLTAAAVGIASIAIIGL
jgi:hypothetical protein